MNRRDLVIASRVEPSKHCRWIWFNRKGVVYWKATSEEIGFVAQRMGKWYFTMLPVGSKDWFLGGETRGQAAQAMLKYLVVENCRPSESSLVSDICIEDLNGEKFVLAKVNDPGFEAELRFAMRYDFRTVRLSRGHLIGMKRWIDEMLSDG